MPPTLSITVPVYNEAKALRRCMELLHARIRTFNPIPEIVIANNGSTDDTLRIAQELRNSYPSLRVLDVKGKGRGLALKQAWNESDADILAYMDCDLSTDLNCFAPLIQPLIVGTHDISIGSRLLPASTTTRGWKRTIVSRCYNLLVRSIFQVRFCDAQCGFKAITSAAAKDLLPHVVDDSWFFDTELLLIAQQAGYRINELPVQWVDDEDSKVNILRTAWDDFRGMLRVRRQRQSKRVLQHQTRSMPAHLW